MDLDDWLDDWLKFMNDVLWLRAWQKHIAHISRHFMYSMRRALHSAFLSPWINIYKWKRNVQKRRKIKCSALCSRKRDNFNQDYDGCNRYSMVCAYCIPTYLSSAQSGQVWLKWNKPAATASRYYIHTCILHTLSSLLRPTRSHLNPVVASCLFDQKSYNEIPGALPEPAFENVIMQHLPFWRPCI